MLHLRFLSQVFVLGLLFTGLHNPLLGEAKALKGTLYINGVTFQNDEAVNLDGQWEFYWKKLLPPGAAEFKKEDKKYYPFPSTWNSDKAPYIDKSQGYATYRLTLYVADSLPSMMLRIPYFYTAYNLYLNGNKVTSNGKVGTSKAETVPKWDPQSRYVEVNPGKNIIVLHIANFHHIKGGTNKSITLTSSRNASYLDNLKNSSYLFVFGAFLVTSIFSLTIFFFHRNDHSFLYFSLFGFAYLYRLIGSDTYIAHDLFPNLSWGVAIRFEYASIFLAIAAFSYYLWYILRYRFSITYAHILSGISGLMLVSLVFSPITFTQFMPYYLLLIGVLYLAYLVYTIVTHNIQTPEAISQIVSLLSIAVILTFQISNYFEITGAILWINFLGYSIFIVSTAVGLAWRFGKNFKASNEAGEAAAKTQQDFLNTMSHELRTPMNAILGMTDFLLESDLKSDQKEKVETIKSNGENLNNIMLDVLSFSEMGSGDIKLEKQHMNIHECIDVAVELTHKLIKAKDIDLEVDISSEIPEKLIGDPARIKQIFVHLFSNAFKFTERGHVKLRGLRLEDEGDYLNLKFRMEDTGIGIKKSKLHNIFDAFSQIESGNTRQFGGAGLGLTITRQLVQLMNGSLNIESTPGKGTKVDMVLQLRKPKENKNGSLREAVRQSQELNKELNVMYAEDNPINQKLLTMMLKGMGIKVDIAENGREAWQMAMKNSYDIVLMDIQMPEMDGIDATKNIVRDVAERPIIIAVTANAGAADKKRAISSGMNDFIAKPIKADTLKKTLIKWQGIHEYLDDTSANTKGIYS